MREKREDAESRKKSYTCCSRRECGPERARMREKQRQRGRDRDWQEQVQETKERIKMRPGKARETPVSCSPLRRDAEKKNEGRKKRICHGEFFFNEFQLKLPVRGPRQSFSGYSRIATSVPQLEKTPGAVATRMPAGGIAMSLAVQGKRHLVAFILSVSRYALNDTTENAADARR